MNVEVNRLFLYFSIARNYLFFRIISEHANKIELIFRKVISKKSFYFMTNKKMAGKF